MTAILTIMLYVLGGGILLALLIGALLVIMADDDFEDVAADKRAADADRAAADEAVRKWREQRAGEAETLREIEQWRAGK